MAVASKGLIGALLASIFCKRINSCANRVVTQAISLFAPEEINMLVTFRMNRDFMEFMKSHCGNIYSELLKEMGGDNAEGNAISIL